MGKWPRSLSFWSLPLLTLWSLFFVVGLVPSVAFQYTRGLANVVTQRALVNTPYAITVAFAFYFSFFVFQRCRESGLTPAEAQTRAFYVYVLGMIAFLDFPLLTIFDMPEELSEADRYLLYVTGLAKLSIWFYLYMTIFRYYSLDHREVFAALIPLRRVRVHPTPAGNPSESDAGEYRRTSEPPPHQDGPSPLSQAPASDPETNQQGSG